MPPSVAKEGFLRAPQKDPGSLSSESSAACHHSWSGILGWAHPQLHALSIVFCPLHHGEADEVGSCTLDKTLDVSQFLLVTL